jgi:N-methylhydantoinase B
MAFRGGAGYGPATQRSRAEILRDLAGGYISPQAAAEAYGLDEDTIDDTLKRAHNGEVF